MVIWDVHVHLLVWLAWTDPRSSNCCCSDCFSSPMPMRFSVHPHLLKAAALEMMETESRCEPLSGFSAAPALATCQVRWSSARDWREMRWTVLWVVREARAAVVQKLRRHRVVVTRRGISVAVIAGNLRCVCLLRHRSVALNWTVNVNNSTWILNSLILFFIWIFADKTINPKLSIMEFVYVSFA